MTDLPDNISVCDIMDARTFVTTVDEYVLLRIRTRNHAMPEIWLRLDRADFIGLAAHLWSDAEQLKVLH